MPPTPAQESSIRVLVVDDDVDVLDVLRLYLGKIFDVRAVATGREALEIARDWPPHTLVTDIRMPDMNGFMLLQEMGRLVPGIHRIAFSANYDPGDARSIELVERYAERALSKPVQPEALVKVIRELSSSEPR